MDSAREIFPLFLLLCMFLQHTEAQTPKDVNCGFADSCDQCFRRHPSCAWCKDEGLNLFSRCKNYADLKKTCKSIAFTKSDEDIPTVDLRKGGRSDLTLKLRSGESVKFNVTIRRGEFPVDLYYLMDITGSVSFQIPTLANYTKRIIDRVKSRLTPDVRIGLGQFCDKTMPPFFRHKPTWELYQVPATAGRGHTCGFDSRNYAHLTQCGDPVGFKHVISLTTNVTEFQKTVSETKVLRPILEEEPRAQFDALYQSIVCEEEIGWSRHLPGSSIRLAILVSDKTAHFAGDGIIGGVLDPMEDEKCFLNSEGVYYRVREQDFPSPGQVKTALEAHQVLVIMVSAISPTRPGGITIGHYRTLSNVWGAGVALTATIELENQEQLSDVIVNVTTLASEQAVPLLRTGYGVLDQLSGIDMSVKAYCPVSEESGGLIRGKVQGCRHMGNFTEATFEVTLSAGNCSTYQNTRNLLLYFNPGYGYVNITVDNLCDCNCTSQPAENSKVCNEHGNLICGVCVCGENTGWVGKFCGCNKTITESQSSPEQQCKPPGSSPVIPNCLGNGECSVNKSCWYNCSCFEGFHGQFCECNDDKCPRVDNQPCGGQENGRCKCAVQGSIQGCSGCTCQCNPGYLFYEKTQACCKEGNEGCSKTSSALVCSGNGDCKCRTCECFGSWKGRFCDSCVGDEQQCPTLCRRTLPCRSAPAECKDKHCCLCNGKVGPSPNGGKTCLSNCSSIYCAGVNPLSKSPSGTYSLTVEGENGTTRSVDHKACPVREGSCTVTYYVAVNPFDTQRVLAIAIDPEKSCSDSFNYTPVILGIVFGLLGLAILVLVIFKIVIHILDAREYRRFVEAQKNAKWEKESNPIFKSATQTFTNPEYKGGARR